VIVVECGSSNIAIDRFHPKKNSKFITAQGTFRFEDSLPTNRPDQGCQMVYFHTQNPDLGNFWRSFEWKMMVHFSTIWNILRSFGIMYYHLVIIVVILVYFSLFACLDQEKHGKPGPDQFNEL
jgi:hypothetical protein